MPRPYTYVGKHTAQNERCGIYGIFEGEEQSNDIPKVGQYKICIPQPRFVADRGISVAELMGYVSR